MHYNNRTRVYTYPVAQFNVPQHLCIHHLLEEQAKRIPDALAIMAPGRSPLPYDRLYMHIDNVGHTLHSMGLGRHDRVALILPNGPEMAVAFLSVAAHATCAPLNPAHSTDEFDLYLAELQATALIVQTGIASSACAVAQARGLSVIELSPALGDEAGIFTLAGKHQLYPIKQGFASPDDVALMIPTAGTTSQPKIVPLTHVNICTAVHNLSLAFGLVESDRCLNVLPLFHVHALLTALLVSITAGASIVCAPGFQAPTFFALLEEFHPTWYTASPTIHQEILSQATQHREIVRRCPLRFIRSGSAALPPQVLSALEKVFSTHVIETYGATEASGHITCHPLLPNVCKVGSVGQAAGPEVAIMDDGGTLLSAGEIGEIVVRGPTVMQGYYGNSTATRNAFTHGWFRTGDQGYLDTDGYLFITGRLKEIINRGGQKISPQEVEKVLMEHPAVAEVAAFAMHHAQLGEDVAAAVVLHTNASATAKEIRAFAAARLADFKVPRQVLFVDEIPKGATGKVQRIGLAERPGLLVPGQAQPKANTAFTGLRTPAEAALAKIWAQVLGLEHVGIHDDFFELGGHSLQAVHLFAQIEQVFGKHLPLPTLFQAPTVEQLATILRQDEWSAPWSSLVAIQPSGSQPPFFCVHPHGGHVIVFKDLAYHLGLDQPFYGLQAQGLDGKPSCDSAIEDIAAHYIQEICTIQPEGPYYLGGYCFGGRVAFEMAQQLHAQGQKVGLLALLDSYAPGYPKALPWAQRIEQRVTYHLGNLRQLGPQKKLDYLLEKGRTLKTRLAMRVKSVCKPYLGIESPGLPALQDVPGHQPAAAPRGLGIESPVLRALRQVEETNLQAASHYVPKVYAARIILFRPSKPDAGYSHDLQMGWSRLAAGGLEIHEIPGSHQAIIVEPWVRSLAEELRACLRRAWATNLEKAASSAGI